MWIPGTYRVSYWECPSEEIVVEQIVSLEIDSWPLTNHYKHSAMPRGHFCCRRQSFCETVTRNQTIRNFPHRRLSVDVALYDLSVPRHFKKWRLLTVWDIIKIFQPLRSNCLFSPPAAKHFLANSHNHYKSFSGLEVYVKLMKLESQYLTWSACSRTLSGDTNGSL